MIAVMNTGGANLASVMNALQRLGVEATLSADAAVIRRASHVIMPGVGAAADAMAALARAHLVALVCTLRQPVLGICLGMQLLFERSSEGDSACLGILPGRVEALVPDAKKGVSVPHMGWNNLIGVDARCPLLTGVDAEAFFYFVHSYRVPAGPWVRASTQHGATFPAVIQHDNFFGVQFHPERSAAAGAALIARFVRL